MSSFFQECTLLVRRGMVILIFVWPVLLNRLSYYSGLSTVITGNCPGLSISVTCRMMSIPCFTIAGEWAVSRKRGNNVVIAGMKTDSCLLANMQTIICLWQFATDHVWSSRQQNAVTCSTFIQRRLQEDNNSGNLHRCCCSCCCHC